MELMRGRAREIVAALSTGEPSSDEVFTAFAELDALPPAIVREVLGGWVGSAPVPEGLDDALRAHGLPPTPLRLRRVAAVKDADILDLGEIAEEQLRLAGKSWDGLDLAAEERLDGELEGSFAGTLEHHVFAAADAPAGGAGAGAGALYDVLLYAGDAGAVFRAGTTELVGLIADGRVEMADRRARAAIQEMLEPPPVETVLATPVETPAEPAAEEPVVRKTRAAAPKKKKAASAAKPKKKTAAVAAAAAKPKKTAAKKKTTTAKTTAKRKKATET